MLDRVNQESVAIIAVDSQVLASIIQGWSHDLKFGCSFRSGIVADIVDAMIQKVGEKHRHRIQEKRIPTLMPQLEGGEGHACTALLNVELVLL